MEIVQRILGKLVGQNISAEELALVSGAGLNPPPCISDSAKVISGTQQLREICDERMID